MLIISLTVTFCFCQHNVYRDSNKEGKLAPPLFPLSPYASKPVPTTPHSSWDSASVFPHVSFMVPPRPIPPRPERPCPGPPAGRHAGGLCGYRPPSACQPVPLLRVTLTVCILADVQHVACALAGHGFLWAGVGAGTVVHAVGSVHSHPSTVPGVRRQSTDGADTAVAHRS